MIKSNTVLATTLIKVIPVLSENLREHFPAADISV